MDAIAQTVKYCEIIHYSDYDPFPEDHWCTYPVYNSNGGPVAIEASAEFTANWKKACQVDRLHEGKLDFQACTTPLGHYFQWAYPDALPERTALGAALSDCAFFWDDVTDSISVEQNAKLTQDFGIAMLSELQAGRRIEAKFAINKIAVQLARDLISVDPFTGIGHLKGWKGHLDAQEKSTHNNMTWQQYVKHRVAESGGNWGISFGCWTNDIRISDEEKTSVKYLTELACAGGILGNDYYSFPKEYDEHHRSGTLDRIQNSVALFMRDYGYTEQEAKEIVKKEVQRREGEFMDAFDAWSRRHAGPEASEVRRYLVMVMLLMSGSMFWMSHAGRYHRTDLETTSEHRATLIGKSNGPLRVMEGYPPPKSIHGTPPALPNSIQDNIPAETNGSNPPVKSMEERVHEQNAEQNGNGASKESSINNGLQEESCRVKFCSSMDLYTTSFKEASSEVCDAPYDYINSLPSKKVRNKLFDALNHWLQVPPSSADLVKNIIHMLHNSSLMLDDIEDYSALRRGYLATHTLYGVSQTINSANFVYVKTVGEVARLYNPRCLEIFIEELSNLHCGQSLDLYWRYNARCPTVEEYLVMVDNKTGGLFRLMLRLMTAESLISLPLDTTLVRLLTLTGRYYQIRDDYLNLTSADYTSKKGFCEDFDEGKFSLPLIHLLSYTPYPDRIISAIFYHSPGTKLAHEVKEYIVAAMEAAQSLDYTRNVLKHLHTELMRTLDEAEEKLGVNNGVRLLLLGLAVGS
ncbi:isoprenoid synthase domain-containing protein [Aspergillus heterothallicus]